MIKTSQFCTIHQETTCKSSLHSNLIISTDFHSFTVYEEKLQNSPFTSFLLRSGYAILVKIWKWLKLLNSYPFIKKRLVNHVYIRIELSSLTFTVSRGMKANIKISQFSRFLLKSEYAIQVKIWKWLKLLNSVPFIKKPLVNQVCIWIWSFWLTFTVLQWMKKDSKNSQFSSFLLSLYSNLIILTVQQTSKFSDFGQDLKMTKTS